MASSDSKSRIILPASQSLDVKPGSPMYVEGAETSVPVRRRPTTLRRVLLGLVFILVYVLLFKWPKFASVYPLIEEGEIEFNNHNENWYYDVPPDLFLRDCVKGSKWTRKQGSDGRVFPYASTSFDLPLSTDNLFILSRGMLSGGTLVAVASPDQDTDRVTVNVVASDHQELAKACLVSRGDTQQGVGIFTPTWESGSPPPNRENTLRIFTTVTFPASSDNASVVAVRGFSTDVPDTAHSITMSLASKIHFDSISLKGSNADISVRVLSATKGSLHTSNGSISGTFNTTTSLYLETSNGAIQADVGLFSNSTEPVLDARTRNGKIDARLRLTSSAGDGGKFNVSTVTSNSPVFVIVADAPVDSALSLEAGTSNGRAHVYLHPTYEGNFDVETSSQFSANLNFLPAVDPSGKQRGRWYTRQRQNISHVIGSTSWHEGSRIDTGVGKVNIHTSNAAVVLDILGR